MTDHLSRRMGFITTGRAWCDYTFGPRDKHYLTLAQMKRNGNGCKECEARYLATIKKPTTFEGKPKAVNLTGKSKGQR